MFITDVHALGLNTAQGLIFTESFYWDLNDQTRAWSRKRFAPAMNGKMPDDGAGRRLLGGAALPEGGGGGRTDDGAKVVASKMKDAHRRPAVRQGQIRADGRKMHPAYLVEVKKPAESKGPWDYYKSARRSPPTRPSAAGRIGRLPAGEEVRPPHRATPRRRHAP
jgi:branched-chain amino acid transport system substrate-binding protein